MILLVDYNVILVKNRLENFKKIISPPSESGLGILIEIPDDVFDRLEKASNKLSFVDSAPFLGNIKNLTYVIYDSKNEKLQLFPKEGFNVEEIIETLRKVFPENTLVWVKFKIPDTLRFEYARNGFQYSHFCFVDFICMGKRLNDKDTVYVPKLVDEKSQDCFVEVSFDKDTLFFLKNLCVITDVEVAGAFDLIDKKFFVNFQSLVYGDGENVSVHNDLFNFHTHPRSAYRKNNTELGVPSGQDFLGYLSSYVEDKTICHTVASLEGLYILSMNKNGKKNIPSDKYNYIKKRYDIPGVAVSGEDFKKITEDIPKRLFDVSFVRWEDAEGKRILVSFDKTRDGNCLAEKRTLEVYKKING